jgi:hypothetical protein
MNRSYALSLGAAFLVAITLSVSACKQQAGTTPIKTLLDDPSRFDKQTVRIAGTVEEAAAVLGYGTYHLDDGTGKLWVVSQGGGAPRNGAMVGVEGEFRTAFTLGDQSGSVLMESRRFTP